MSVQNFTATVKDLAFDTVIASLEDEIVQYHAKLRRGIECLQGARAALDQPDEYLDRVETIRKNEECLERIRQAEQYLREVKRLSLERKCDIVQTGALVEVVDGDNPPEIYFVLVANMGIDYASRRAGIVNRQFIIEGVKVIGLNPQAPVGKALLGHRAGDTITVQTPGGPRTIQINSVA
ncbi:MAG: GreA/GreB family elongation factor [Candidatus Spechtbacteria bacterium]|nr:GreA/GreB family elongation factor [Candidatus Spechtbacteria bacterium]